MGSTTSRIDQLVAEFRLRLPRRPAPAELPQLIKRGVLVVDIRPVEQRLRDGVLEGAMVIDRNVLEWRLDPSSPHCIPGAPGRDDVLVIMCDQGYQSSIAAGILQQIGLRGATDLTGGFQAVLAEPALDSWIKPQPG